MFSKRKSRTVRSEDKLEMPKVGHGSRFPPVTFSSTGTFLKEAGDFGVPRLGFAATKMDRGGGGSSV